MKREAGIYLGRSGDEIDVALPFADSSFRPLVLDDAERAIAGLRDRLGLAGEFVVRKLWFRHYGEGAFDRVFRLVFPPERTANGRRSLAYVAARRAASASPSA